MSFGICKLNSQFNKVIAEYLSKGFELSPFTQGGSFSNSEAHMDIVDPKDKKHVYRVWIVRGSAQLDDSCRYSYADTMNIKVKRYDYDKRHPRTLWPDDGETISEKVFYIIKSGKAYTDSIEEACEINRKRNNRYNAKSVKPDMSYDDDNYRRSLPIEKLPENFIDNIMAKINRIRGFKRASATCIKDVSLYKERRYRYSYNKYHYDLKAQVHYSFNGKSGYIYIG